jgi:adenylate cyclase
VGMDVLAEPRTCRFDDFLLDREAYALFRLNTSGERIQIPIGSRGFEILRFLIDRRGEFVSRREIMDAVWPGAVVEDSNLSVQMAALRRVLDSGRTRGSCIQTVPGRGYRFLSQVTEAISQTAVADTSPPLEDSGSASASPEQAGLRVVRHVSLSWRHIPRLPGLAGAACLFVVVLFAAYAWYHSSGSAPQGGYPRLSVAVLPFENLSGDPQDDRLTDGITEDLTTDLSYTQDALVVAPGSASRYKGKAEDVRRIGEALGVRYAVSGSLQRLGSTLRVDVQLTSTETGTEVWSDRLDEPIKDLFARQEDIVTRLNDELAASMINVEATRSLHDHPADPDAFDLVLRARSLRNLPQSPQHDKEIIALLEQALSKNPASLYAMTYIAFFLTDIAATASIGWGDFESMRRAEHLLQQARTAAPNSELVLNTYVYWLRSVGRCPEAIELTQHAIKMNSSRIRTMTGVYNELSICKTWTGDTEEGLALQEEADRLNPRSPYKMVRYGQMGWALVLLGRDQEAIIDLERSLAISAEPGASYTAYRYRLLAAADARSGHLDEAKQHLSAADQIWPYDTVRLGPLYLLSSAYAEEWQRYKSALRLTGERDHVEEDVDFGVPTDGALHSETVGRTPKGAVGVKTIRTTDLGPFLATARPLVVDTVLYSWNKSIPGAVGLQFAGLGGSFTDEAQDRLRSKMQTLTDGELSKPIVTIGSNAEHFDGRNLALRLASLGYTNVYWYRGGREAWEVKGLPETHLDIQQW